MNDISRKKYDVLEFVKEIVPEMDLSKINMHELALKKDEIKTVIIESKDYGLSAEEEKAIGLLEMLDEIEVGEEINIDTVGAPNINLEEISDIVTEDLDLLVAPIDPITSALVYEIQGGGNYQARVYASSREWENRKAKGHNGRSIEHSR